MNLGGPLSIELGGNCGDENSFGKPGSIFLGNIAPFSLILFDCIMLLGGGPRLDGRGVKEALLPEGPMELGPLGGGGGPDFGEFIEGPIERLELLSGGIPPGPGGA